LTHKPRKKVRRTRGSIQEIRFPLDQFSQADIRTWKRIADDAEEYHIRQYFHLESLRSLHQEALLDALKGIAPTSIQLERWVRIVDYKYSHEPLSSVGSLFSSGRFNIGRDLNPGQFPPYPALYIAEDYPTAYAEKFGVAESEQLDGISGHELALRKPASFASINISGNVSNLFDVGRAANFRKFMGIISKFKMPNELKDLARAVGIKQPWMVNSIFMLKETILTNAWRFWPTQLQIPANPQIMGRLIKDAGFEGVIYPSTKGAGRCIAVFPEVLDKSDSYLELTDEAPTGVTYTRLDSLTWRELV
jgi:RES domain